MGISRGKAGNVVDCPTCGRTVRVPELDGSIKPLPPVGLNLDDAKLKNALNHLTSQEVAQDEPADLNELKSELQQLIDQPDASPADSDRINVIDPGPVEPDEVIELPIPEQKPAIELSPVDALPARPAPAIPAADKSPAPVATNPPRESHQPDPEPPSHTQPEARNSGSVTPSDANRDAVIGQPASTSVADSAAATIDLVETAEADSDDNIKAIASDEAPRADIPADLLATLGTVSESFKAEPSAELPSQELASSQPPADLAETLNAGSDSEAPDSTPVPKAPTPEIVESQPTLDSATINASELKQELDALAAMAPATNLNAVPLVASKPGSASKSIIWTIAVFCVFAGFLIGRSFGGGSSDQETAKTKTEENGESKTQSSKPSPTKITTTNQSLTGRITYRTALDESLPDSGARVILLPRQASVEKHLPVDGLRPGDANSLFETASQTVAHAGGVAVTVTNDGTFTAEVPQTGNYHVLLFSKFHRRGNDSNLTPDMQQALNDYFAETEQRKLLGQWGIAYGRIRIDGKKPVPWDHVFQ